MQEKYWNFMVQVKSSINYLDIYAENSYKWDSKINVISAIASSSSIAGWAIWNDFSYIWAFIIASAQVLTAIKDYIPFRKRLKLLRPFTEDMIQLYIKTEYNWYKVSEGQLTESEINALLFSYKKEFASIESKYMKDGILLENSKYMKEADEKTTSYFANNF